MLALLICVSSVYVWYKYTCIVIWKFLSWLWDHLGYSLALMWAPRLAWLKLVTGCYIQICSLNCWCRLGSKVWQHQHRLSAVLPNHSSVFHETAEWWGPVKCESHSAMFHSWQPSAARIHSGTARFEHNILCSAWKWPQWKSGVRVTVSSMRELFNAWLKKQSPTPRLCSDWTGQGHWTACLHTAWWWPCLGDVYGCDWIMCLQLWLDDVFVAEIGWWDCGCWLDNVFVAVIGWWDCGCWLDNVFVAVTGWCLDGPAFSFLSVPVSYTWSAALLVEWS